MNINLKRIYDKFASNDGTRILVDRIWPRGISKKSAKIDIWLKDIAPSDELRKWFNHDPEKWTDFKKKYKKELSENTSNVNQTREIVKEGKVTLIYSAKDREHNQAFVIKEYLEEAIEPDSEN